MSGPIALVQGLWLDLYMTFVCKWRGHRTRQINDSAFTYCARCGQVDW